jgi:uncharacterized protein (DUF849 family)
MAAPQKKVIVTCAITGGIHTPTMSPHLPITADQIAQESIAAAQAGASIVHLHARHPENGQPSQDSKLFRAFLPTIASRSDVVINLTTGGAPNMLVEERLQPALVLKAGSGLAEHGLDELRPVSHAGASQAVQIRLGAPVSGGLRRPRVPQYVDGHVNARRSF